jgi:hypothetical protein
VSALKRIHEGVSEPLRSVVESTRDSPYCIARIPTVLCDTAIVGAFYKSIQSQGGGLWYFVKSEGAEGGTGLSIHELDDLLEEVLSDVTADSLVGRGKVHTDCYPWPLPGYKMSNALDVEHMPEVSSLVSDQVAFLRRQAEKSGLCPDIPEAVEIGIGHVPKVDGSSEGSMLDVLDQP